MRKNKSKKDDDNNNAGLGYYIYMAIVLCLRKTFPHSVQLLSELNKRKTRETIKVILIE